MVQTWANPCGLAQASAQLPERFSVRRGLDGLDDALVDYVVSLHYYIITQIAPKLSYLMRYYPQRFRYVAQCRRSLQVQLLSG